MTEQSSPVEPLTGREADVLSCIAKGLSNIEIAAQLFLSPSTIKWYVRQLNSKLDTQNREEIVERARELGLLNATHPLETISTYPHNLPYQTTPFVGRDAELDEFREILAKPEVRLVTVLAHGGMGKTRFALEAAEQQLNRFEDGVYFVALQPIADIEQIVPAVAQQLGLQFMQDARSLKQQLMDYLSNKQILLVVDNWEHLLDGAPLISELLQAAPGVKVLATSREKLKLSGETVYGLRGMQFQIGETLEAALKLDAVKLLAQTARRVQANFQVTAENLVPVMQICQLTEGMPLGILLAVSWLDVLPLERIVDELRQNIDFLETEMRDLPERQRSIRAIFEATWERLEPAEQQVFMKLSVFKGGCSLEAAQVVTGAKLRTLQVLVNKALLLQTKTGRYDIHELLRQYSYERLEASGLVGEVLRQHSSYYAGFLHQRESDLKGRRQLEAHDEIEAELDNIRQFWYQALRDEAITLIDQALFSMATYMEIRCREVEYRPLFTDAEAVFRVSYADHPTYAKLLIHCAVTGYILSQRWETAEQMLKQALKIGTIQDDRAVMA